MVRNVVVIGCRVDITLLLVETDEGFVDVNVFTIVVGAFVIGIVGENIPTGVIVVETVG